MLILLASEGTALRKAADDRMLRARIGAPRDDGKDLQETGTTEVSVEARDRGMEEWRMWAAPPALGAAHRAP